MAEEQHKVIKLNSEEELDKVIAQTDIVVVDFFAVWCGPCVAIAPMIEEMADEYEKLATETKAKLPPVAETQEEVTPKQMIKFVKVDVDELSHVAAKYGVRAMPTFMVFKDGEKVSEVVGANPPAIKAAIENTISERYTPKPIETPPVAAG